MMNKLKNEVAQATVAPVKEDEEGAVMSIYRFPADFVGFAGHFPGYAIVPAIVQVLAAQQLAESRLPGGMRLSGVRSAKFFLQLPPEQDITVECRLQPKESEVHVATRLTCEQGLAASFTLTFSPERSTA